MFASPGKAEYFPLVHMKAADLWMLIFFFALATGSLKACPHAMVASDDPNFEAKLYLYLIFLVLTCRFSVGFLYTRDLLMFVKVILEVNSI